VVGRQVGEHADGRHEVGRVVQLEGGHLHRDPVGQRIVGGQFRQRPTDVACRFSAEPAGAEQVRQQRGGGGLAVGAGHHGEP
jgi:hypothetical protein